jgi:hypothetical protein
MGTPEFHGWRACDACGEAIERIEDAVLTVSPDLLEQRRAALAEQARARAAGEEASKADTGLVPWDWGHRDCIPPRPADYVVDGSRVASLEGLTVASFGLLAQPWFVETAWEDAARRFYDLPLT